MVPPEKQINALVRKHTDTHGDGHTIPCCWSDCGRDGVELHKIVEARRDGSKLIFLFCSEKHRVYYSSASRYGHGNLPPGWKNQYIPLH